MTYPRLEGLTIQPGGSIQNLVVETLSANPSTPALGRIFYNSTTRAFTGTFFNGTANTTEAILVTSSLTPVNSAISALDGRVTTAESNITSLQGTTSSQGTAITNLTTRMGTAESNISNLQGRMTTTEGNVTSLTTRMGTAETNITNLQTSSGNNTTAIGTLANLLTTNKSNLVSAINEVFQGPATSLVTGRTFSVTGDATGTSAAFNGTANASIPLTLANTGVAAGFYGNSANVPRFEVDSKGRIISVTLVPITGGGGGATAFTQLTDVPASYTGAGGYVVRVKADATGLEFVPAPSGTPTLQQVFAASTSPQLTVNGASGPLTLKQSDAAVTPTLQVQDSTNAVVVSITSDGKVTATSVTAATGTFSGAVTTGALTAASVTSTLKSITVNAVTTPTDANADGGGLILKGATDKSILYTNATTSWTMSENLALASGKTYSIGTTLVASGTAFGPLSGAAITALNASALTTGTVPAARLPIAAAATLGAVRVGSGLSIDGAGILSANAVATTWGSITGTLSNQTDLQAALDAKVATTGTNSQVYATTGAGAQTTLAYSAGATASSVAQRTAQSQLLALTVADTDGNATANDLVNRGYVAALSGLRVTRVALANAGSYNATTDYDVVIFTGGPVASYTVNLPSNLTAYAKLQLVFEGAVTTVTVAPGTKSGGGNNVIDFAPVLVKAGDTFAWGYDATAGEWMVNSVWTGASRDFRNTSASAGNIYSSVRALDSGAMALTMWNDARTVATDVLTAARNGNVTITGAVAASNLSGTNTGDQTITLTGDVTGSGTGSFATTLATVNGSPVSNAFVKVTTNGKGLVTATSAVTQSDITGLLGSTYVPLAGGVTMTGSLTAPSFVGPLTGNADTATALATGRTFSVTGDATGTSAAFTGAANASIPLTLATVNAGPVSNALSKVTTNAKGLVTATTAVVAGDLTPLLNSVYVPQGGGVPINNLTALTVGTTTAMALALGATAVTPVVEVFGATAAASSSGVIRASADANGSALFLAKTRGTTATDFTTVAVSDVLGALVFDGATGSAMNEGARISAVTTSVGTGTVSARLDFATTEPAATAPTTRMSISNLGVTTVTTSVAATAAGLVVNQANTGASGQAQIQANSDTSGIALGANGSGWSTNTTYGTPTEAWVRSAAAAAGLYLNTGAGPLRLAAVGAESARITNSRVLAGGTAEMSAAIGTTTNLSSRLQVFGNASALASTNIVQGSADAVGPSLFLGKTRNATINTLTIVQVGDDLGSINFNGAATASMAEGARITSTVESVASGTVGANLRFLTTASAGTTPSERARIDTAGNLMVGTTTPAGRVTITGGVTGTGGETTIQLQSSNQATIPALITTGASAGTLSLAGGPASIAGSARGGQIDLLGGGAGGIIQFRTGTGTGGTAQPEVARFDANGFLGIGLTSPGARIHALSGDAARSSTAIFQQTNQSTFTIQGQQGSQDIGAANGTLLFNSVGNLGFRNGTSGNAQVLLSAAGNVGIGTTDPDTIGSKLNVVTAATALLNLTSTATDTGNFAEMRLTGNDNAFRISSYGSTHTVRGNTVWLNVNGGTQSLVLSTGNTERVRLDTAGNLAVGGNAPGWGLGNAITIGSSSAGGSASFQGDNGGARLTQGCYYTGAAWTRSGNNGSSLYTQSGASHIWANAAAGTIGTTFSPAESMRLLGDGSLMVGTNTYWSGNSGKVTVGYAGAAAIFGMTMGSVASTGTAIQFLTSAALNGGSSTTAGSITVSGATTAFNTSSDYRMKDIEGRVTAEMSASFIDRLAPKYGTWKHDGSYFCGFLAHEFQEVSPGSVQGVKDDLNEDGTPRYQSMQASSAEVMANVVTELQTLRMRMSSAEQDSSYGPSDYRLKNVTGAVTQQMSGAFIDALRPIYGTMKSSGVAFTGFVADQFATVSPNSVRGTKDAVDAQGNPIYQMMTASSPETIANLVAEVQFLRARCAALETRVTAAESNNSKLDTRIAAIEKLLKLPLI